MCECNFFFLQYDMFVTQQPSTIKCSFFFLWASKPMERAHVTSRFVHCLYKVNMVGFTPIIECKNVLKKEQYDGCIKKGGKTWYNLTIHAMTKFLFKVKVIPSMDISP